MVGITEIIIILVVIGLVFFGVKKIPEIARTLGRFRGEFEKGKMEVEKELKKVKEEMLKGGKESTSDQSKEKYESK
jgi:sec-independent protein translocase protein TatA